MQIGPSLGSLVGAAVGERVDGVGAALGTEVGTALGTEVGGSEPVWRHRVQPSLLSLLSDVHRNVEFSAMKMFLGGPGTSF